MSYILIYLMFFCLFWFFYLNYMPRYTFYSYLKNEELDNLKLNWKLYEIETIYKNYSYFLLIHNKTNDILIFDYDKKNNLVYIKDDRFKSYQENKKLTELILSYYEKEDFNNADKLDEEKYDKLKKENPKSYYFTGGYDFQIKTKFNIS